MKVLAPRQRPKPLADGGKQAGQRMAGVSRHGPLAGAPQRRGLCCRLKLGSVVVDRVTALAKQHPAWGSPELHQQLQQELI